MSVYTVTGTIPSYTTTILQTLIGPASAPTFVPIVFVVGSEFVKTHVVYEPPPQAPSTPTRGCPFLTALSLLSSVFISKFPSLFSLLRIACSRFKDVDPDVGIALFHYLLLLALTITTIKILQAIGLVRRHSRRSESTALSLLHQPKRRTPIHLTSRPLKPSGSGSRNRPTRQSTSPPLCLSIQPDRNHRRTRHPHYPLTLHLFHDPVPVMDTHLQRHRDRGKPTLPSPPYPDDVLSTPPPRKSTSTSPSTHPALPRQNPSLKPRSTNPTHQPDTPPPRSPPREQTNQPASAATDATARARSSHRLHIPGRARTRRNPKTLLTARISKP